MAQFMLLIRGGGEAWDNFVPEQAQQEYQKYFAWADQLRSEGRLHGADELKGGGKTVRVRDGQTVVDGPYVETKEGVGGYYLIEAADENEAAEIAKGCPTLRHSGLIEVREINEHA